MNRKRGKTPSLITGSSGKPSKVIAKRRQKCKRCDSDIFNGDICFQVPKVGSGFSNNKRFCVNCFKEILIQTKKDIAKLEKEIYE
jgi:hypothetical protein